MKKLIAFLSMALAVLGVSAQSSATSPGTGHWVVIDSGYQVATTTTGQTVAPLLVKKSQVCSTECFMIILLLQQLFLH